MEILIIGGTRNVGHFLTLALLQNGHRVTLFNRGKTQDQLPADVERLHGDRSDPASLAEALSGRSFGVVIDMALYNGADAKTITGLLEDRVGHYIFLSTGQIYLVHQADIRPFTEEASEQPLLLAPLLNTRDYDEWLYGVEKSQAEKILLRAWHDQGFPVTIFRLPMVNSERDHFHRIYNYLLRLQDGGPILLPLGNHLLLRHVYAADIVRAILRVLDTGLGKGRVYNLSQDETISIEDFLASLATTAGHQLQIAYVPRTVLDGFHLLPNCSPFSDMWMSELDNRQSKVELGMQYTPLPIYLQSLVEYFTSHQLPVPEGYQRRKEEIRLTQEI